ncbi:hypothetical protein [Pseudomonas sp. KNUC1026]|uniref:hypothetical protein n=1 Tax=Pseudomonas sp. KNUC1026 TaxID=2893890 RepID=UPI001F420779|nr:hypothetical protein [Pseudomonas sp. KNUC1026]UFH50131.1 hypothetical protein LN139_01945 [Pseudomonas sp. KNUC1026]
MKELIAFEDFMVGRDCAQSWTSVSDIPDCYVRRILGLDMNSQDFQPPDIITPLIKGKEWLFELTQQWQPKTAEILLQGNLFVRPPKSRLLWDFPDLCLDIEGRILILDRKSFGITAATQVINILPRLLKSRGRRVCRKV